nr:uncharacterized protein LOC109166012 [Ipomoea batatas]
MYLVGKIEAAYKLLEEMGSKGYPPDIVTFNCFLKINDVDGAFETWWEMDNSGCARDTETYCLSEVGNLKAIHKLSEHMRTFYNPAMARRFALNQKRKSMSLRGKSSPFCNLHHLVDRGCLGLLFSSSVVSPDVLPVSVVAGGSAVASGSASTELANARVFTKLDLRVGYHQVRMREGDEYKTAFRTHQGLYEFKVMPFGLTNAPATFQALMNYVFKPLIRKTVLVFFDDILVYSPSLGSHWEHLREVLRIMKDHQLLAKLSKCSFAKTEVEYLGHIISEKGLQTDPAKLSAVASWTKPTNIKELRGFLGLTGYYRRFIKSYGTISRPLTNMLKKDAFKWSVESEVAFEELKQALCTAPVLTLPNFNKEFVVEADACYKGMGAVLMQEGKSNQINVDNAQTIANYSILVPLLECLAWKALRLMERLGIVNEHVVDATVLWGEVHIVHVSYRPTSDVPFRITVEGSGNFI